MPLPHPLGDSSPGDMFYPGAPSVIANDVAGAAGSRAVEFGEDGYSSPVNRGLLALAKNDEYINDRLEAPVARLVFTSWTPAGGNGNEYSFAGESVFVGGTDYTPETQQVIDSLFSVLDENYNELIDPSTGYKITVKEVLDSGGSSTVIGTAGGFYTGPKIHFQAVHPVTGAVLVSSYTIPNSTNVLLVCGIESSLESLAESGSEHLMRDAWVKGAIRNAQEIAAGAFLVDGSRKAIGDFDLDNHVLLCDFLESHPGNDLTVGSDIGERIFFRDQWQDTMLNDAPDWSPSGYEDGLASSAFNSLMGSLNGAVKANKAWMSNRALNRTGTITYTAGTGLIEYPELQVCLNGEVLVIPAGSVTAGNTYPTSEFLVVQADGNVALVSGVSATEILIEQHSWDGAAFHWEADLRWPINKALNRLELTCGDGAGSDFEDLGLALTTASLLARQDAEFESVTLRILGTAVWSTSVTFYTNTDLTIAIRGDGVDRSIVDISGSNPKLLMDGSGSGTGVPLTVDGINFRWTMASDSGPWHYLFSSMGNGSRISNCKFSRSNSGFLWGVATQANTPADGITFYNCELSNVLEFYKTTSTGVSNNLRIDNCRGTCASNANAQPLLTLYGRNARVTHNYFNGYWSNFILWSDSGVAGDGGVAAFNEAISTRSASFAAEAIYASSFANPFLEIVSNRFKNYRTPVYLSDITGDARVNILNNNIDGMTHDTEAWGLLIDSALVDVGSRVVFNGNTFQNTSEVIDVKNVYVITASNLSLEVIGNKFDQGQGVVLDTEGVALRCIDNDFYAPNLVSSYVILNLDASGAPENYYISNNRFYIKARSTGAMLLRASNGVIENNTLINIDAEADFNVGQYDVGTGVNSVKDVLATPPGAPTQGYRYLVAESATGAWAGHTGEIVERTVFASWEFYEPQDQSMIWAEKIGGVAAEKWLVYDGDFESGAYKWILGYQDLEPYGIYLYAGYGTKIRGNKMSKAQGGVCLGNEGVRYAQVTDNHFEDMLGAGVFVWSGNYSCHVSHNNFIEVHGQGVNGAGGIGSLVVCFESPYEAAGAKVSKNYFERCGQRWQGEDDSLLVSVTDGIVEGNEFNMLRCSEISSMYVITLNARCVAYGNRIIHDFDETADFSNPYNLYGFWIIGPLCQVQSNHIIIVNDPSAACFGFYGICFESGLSAYGTCIGNSIDPFATSPLTNKFGIKADSGGMLIMGNIVGDGGVVCGLETTAGDVGGEASMAVGNRTFGFETFVNCYPGTSVSAPVNLRGQLNQ